MELRVDAGSASYGVTVERGLLSRAGELLDLRRRVAVVTDRGVPERYAATIASFARNPLLITVEEGEGSKSFRVLEELLEKMLSHGFGRSDAVVAVGGGVVGDLAGFAASLYMRGIDFYNIPTTLLSMVDSSIGGKTAVNFMGVKNVIGSFYQPGRVLIDPDLVSTQTPRGIASGMAEAIKMGVTSDPELFALFEGDDPLSHLEEILVRSLRVKAAVVAADEKEGGLRRVLNFGHTVGHGIESAEKGALTHGECVALGMLPVSSDRVRKRLLPVLSRAGLPTALAFDTESVMEAMRHDKKKTGDKVTLVLSDEIGSFRFEKAGEEELRGLLEKIPRKGERP